MSEPRTSETPPEDWSLVPVAPAPGRAPHRFVKWTLRGLVVVVALLGLAQLVPYGHSHTNPPVQAEPQWDSPQTRALARRACFDCHSNETTWPWYSKVAPVSWLVQNDVSGGRGALNFSEWKRAQESAGEVADAIAGGSMPPWYYTIEHPKAKLSSADRLALLAGLAATFRNSPPAGGGG